MRTSKAGRRALLAAALFAAPLAATLGAAPAQAWAESLGAGLWDMERADANRRCRLTLRGAQTAPGLNALGAPAGCRKALPILAAAAGWTATEGGALRLVGRDGGPLLDFAPKDGGALEAIGPEGEVYRLTSQGGAAARWASEGRVRLAQGGIVARPGETPAPGGHVAQPGSTTTRGGFVVQSASSPAPSASRTAAPVGAAPPRAALPGRYAILREEGRDTGCMVTLEDRGGRGPKGSSRAFLAPACRDQGLVIFDPVGWTLAGGKLLLYANKGHSLSFLPGGDGRSWAKEDAAGKPISLRRL